MDASHDEITTPPVSADEPAPRRMAAGLGFTWPAALVLAMAIGGYCGLYRPEAARTAALEAEVAAARARLGRLQERQRRLRQKLSLLEKEEPETMAEALREGLHRAPPGEWLSATTPQTY